jgi:2-polyprenyl-6-methoxyphenol hydroxylase-like FAD-dependent oxidoreductase
MTRNDDVLRTKKRKKDRLDLNSRIAIIGSGLGGLGAAISLELAGFHNITVYERDESMTARREGYGLTLTYNPRGPLAYMGLLEEVAQEDCPSRSHYTFASDGRILSYYGNAFRDNGGRGQRGNLRLPRQVLRGILLRKVKAPIEFNKRLTGLQQADADDNGRLTLSFQDGSQSSGVDLVIGADGIRSTVVKYLVPNDSGLHYLGIFIVLGIADFHHPLLDERGFYTLDGNHRLFTMPYEGSRLSGTKRRIMWQLSYRLESEMEAQRLSSAGPSVLQEEVLSRCQSWHEPVVQMVMSTPHDTIWGT